MLNHDNGSNYSMAASTICLIIPDKSPTAEELNASTASFLTSKLVNECCHSSPPGMQPGLRRAAVCVASVHRVDMLGVKETSGAFLKKRNV